MQLLQGVQQVFVQLSDSIEQLTSEQYTKKISILSNASIGQHLRHTVELFICLEKGYETGVVNYEKRERDLRIETDKDFANALLKNIFRALSKENKSLLLETGYDEHSEETILIPSNYYREIVYNLEHTVHHMALIRIGINATASIELPENFGVAGSTVKYRKTITK
ncbi:MAG: DinB family protein [Bacteroidetes bacterium]|nr:DinB family protein [Bacteroidota bacterium]